MEEGDSPDEMGKMKGKSILLVIKGPKEHQSPGNGSPCPISLAVRLSQQRTGRLTHLPSSQKWKNTQVLEHIIL